MSDSPGNHQRNHPDTPEQGGRWTRVEQIYHAAGELHGPQRAAYLREACGDDHELRREVESLLALLEAGSSLLAAPLRAAAAEMLDERGALDGAGLRPAALAHDPKRHAGGPHFGPKGVTDLSPVNSPKDSLAESLGDSFIGQTLGPYRVIERIGAGGMGEVYRARDEKLGRDVAIKVLPREYSSDPERLARFRREARTLASLNHPNIATIYGLEEVTRSNGVSHEVTPCLVMELVEGQTLAEKIRGSGFGARGSGARDTGNGRRSGKPVPLREALEIVQQIATGLEHAHEKGIIHRDLKPANVKITPDGTVKLLDFGLAKAFIGESGAALNMDDGITLSELPPGHTPGMPTAPGLLLGTPEYMSPEQARGQAVDKRTDIWALGCILYEMLAGKPAFSGPTITDILAKVIREEPDWNVLPATTPTGICALLRWCLQKDMSKRIRSAADLAILTENVFKTFTPERGVGDVHDSKRPYMSIGRWIKTLGIALTILVLASVVGLLASRFTAKPTQGISRTAISLPLGDRLDQLRTPVVAISPDGRYVAYIAIHNGVSRLFLRAIDSYESRQIADTEEAKSPFFSPDSQWVAFFLDPYLKKVPVAGGPPVIITDQAGGPGTNPRGGSWGSQGTIVFTHTTTGYPWRVAASGGEKVQLPGPDWRRWPAFLPDGITLLATAASAPTVNYDNAEIALERLGRSGLRTLISGGTRPRYVETGHIVFVRAGTLMAVPFDVRRSEVRGSPVAVVEGIAEAAFTGAAQYDLSRNGTLIYVRGTVNSSALSLVWVDRNGREYQVAAPPHAYRNLRLSPDGRRVALAIEEMGGHIWIYDFSRDTFTRLSVEGSLNRNPVWTPDGSRVTFGSGDPRQIYWQAADGSGKAERLGAPSSDDRVLGSWTPDGQTLAFQVQNSNIQLLRLPQGQIEPFLDGPFSEQAPRFSPDGRFIAYNSDESGRSEIYVQAFPKRGGKWQVSIDGGTQAVWNPNGRELFFRNGDKIMAVEISIENAFSVGKPRMLFDKPFAPAPGASPNWDVSPDGQRFLMLKPIESDQTATEINVVLNWFEELKQKVPVP